MQFQSRRSNLRAANGMVSTTQPLAAMAGLRALMRGGNAVDAAVTAAATLNVVEPHSTGMGGDLFALVWMADERRVRALSACGRSPAAASLDELRRLGLREVPALGPYSVTVPGAVSGWDALLRDYGRMTLADALEPAIGYAEDGFPVSEVIASHWSVGAERLSVGPASDELLLNGAAPRAGEAMKTPTLAQSLRTVAEGGADAFYRGDLGERIASFTQSSGGWLTAEDMAAQEATWVEPVASSYRGYDIWQVPPPSQGVNALMALQHRGGVRSGGNGLAERRRFPPPDRVHAAGVRRRAALRDRPVRDERRSVVAVIQGIRR